MKSHFRWKKSYECKIFDLLSNEASSVKQGCSCVFVPVSEKVGAKIYKTKYARNLSYKRQKDAHNAGLGPDIGEKFEITLSRIQWNDATVLREKVYGFLTEIADLSRNRLVGDRDLLQEQLKEIGINHFDLHDQNVGIVNGKFVCIDFDSKSARVYK